MRPWLLVLFVINLMATCHSLLPPMGWSSWNSVQFQVNDSFIRESAQLLSANLADSGYTYILIDDGWPKCLQYAKDHSCLQPHPRDNITNEIVIDDEKFPFGFNNLSDYVHSLGLRLGIYTAVSHTTCGGYTGSLGFEQIDAASFVQWGFDFVKHDTCSMVASDDDSHCGSTNGCIQNSTYLMAYHLHKYSDGTAVYYIDDGNPSTSYRLFNPRGYHCTPSNTLKLAVTADQLIYEWVNQPPFSDENTSNTSLVHMFKSWFDREDAWYSVLDNLHHQIALSIYQKCGVFNMADMLTTAQGQMSFTEYRAEFLLWSVLSTPLIFGATLPQLLGDEKLMQLVTNEEVIAVNQDSDCVQASVLRMMGSWEMWGKPVSGGDVVVVVVNKAGNGQNGGEPVEVTISPFGYEGDFYPMFEDYDAGSFQVRDLVQQKDLGVFEDVYRVKVDAHDAVMMKFSDFKAV